MTHRARLAPLFCAALIAGCDLGACGAAPVAVLTKVDGAVALARAASPERWSEAAVDSELAMGDAIRTSERGTAQLALDDGSVIDLAPSSTLRLLLEAPEAERPTVELIAGAAEIRNDAEADVALPGGSAHLTAGSRIELRRTDQGLELRVQVGRAQFAELGGGVTELAPGHEIALEIGRVAPTTRTAPTAASTPATLDPTLTIVTAGGVLVARPGEVGEAMGAVAPAEVDAAADDALAHADLSVAAGGDVLVRDTGPPTAIRVRFDARCPDGAIVERFAARGGGPLAAGRGASSVSLAFPAGRHRYRVRCLEDGAPSAEPVAQGRVRVMRTSGQTPLPRTAPENRVDVDGRRYTILYQNRLPSVAVRWPGGPPGPRTLVVRTGDATRRVSVRGSEHRFGSGELGVGAHSLRFEADSGNRSSRETSLRIRFDEYAATASLVEPETGSFAPGDTVQVSGTALAGWHVVAGDREIPVGADQRFSGQAVVPASGALVVELRKPGHGVQYYVRRARAGGGTP